MINVLTSAPAFFFGFATLGPFGLLLTSALSGIVLKASNESAAAASSSAKGNRLWSTQGLMMFVSLNVLLSAFSGIGSELMINRSELGFVLAEELITEQEEKLRKLKDDPDVLDVEQVCADLNDLINGLPENAPKRRSAYGRALGSYGNPQDYSQTPDAQTPKCTLADRKRQAARVQYAPLEEKLALQANFESDIDFLEEVFPGIYNINFKTDGSVKSESEEFRLAFQSFYGSLLSGSLLSTGQMGFSVFITLLSVVTSAGACLLMMAHIYRKDTALSHNPQVKDAMERHLVYLEKVLLRGAHSEVNDEDFLSPAPITAEKLAHSESSDSGTQSQAPAETVQIRSTTACGPVNLQTPEAQRAIATHRNYIERNVSSNAEKVIPLPTAIGSPSSQPAHRSVPIKKAVSPTKPTKKTPSTLPNQASSPNASTQKSTEVTDLKAQAPKHTEKKPQGKYRHPRKGM